MNKLFEKIYKLSEEKTQLKEFELEKCAGCGKRFISRSGLEILCSKCDPGKKERAKFTYRDKSTPLARAINKEHNNAVEQNYIEKYGHPYGKIKENEESRESFSGELKYFNNYFDTDITALDVGQIANKIFSEYDDPNDFGENQSKAFKVLNMNRLNLPGNVEISGPYIKGYSILVTKWFEEKSNSLQESLDEPEMINCDICGEEFDASIEGKVEPDEDGLPFAICNNCNWEPDFR